MKIAVTYENGEIFGHFGHTKQFKIYNAENGKVVSSEVIDTNGSGHGALAGLLSSLGADVLICGGIGGGAQRALDQAGIKLFGGVQGNADEAVLVHGGLVDFEEDKDLSEYDIHDIIWGRCDYARQYYKDKYLVTGHTPTYNIDENYKGKIYRQNNHIAIDCGAVFAGTLGCICLDTLEEFYV